MHSICRAQLFLGLLSTICCFFGQQVLLAQSATVDQSNRRLETVGLSEAETRTPQTNARRFAEFRLKRATIAREAVSTAYDVALKTGTVAATDAPINAPADVRANDDKSAAAGKSQSVELTVVVSSHPVTPGQGFIDYRTGKLVLTSTDMVVPAGAV